MTPTVTATVFRDGRDLRVRLAGDLPAGLVAFGRAAGGNVVIDCTAGDLMPLVPVMDYLAEEGRAVRGLESLTRRLAG